MVLCAPLMASCQLMVAAEREDQPRQVMGSTWMPLTSLQLVSQAMAAWEADWYKDEGGRDKSIPLHIQLLDAKGRLVRDRSLPLKVTLHYEKTYLSVTNQEVRSCRCW